MLSILVISRSQERMTTLLRSIGRSKLDEQLEVLVAWNGKDEPPFEPSAERTVQVHYYQVMPYNFARNNNLLAKNAHGASLLFLNDDIILDPDCLQNALNELRKPEIGIVGANLRFPNGMVQHAGLAFKDDQPYHRFKHELAYDDPQVSTDLFVPAVTGAFILIRKEEFAAIKFDERFIVAGEDVALCLRYRQLFKKGVLYCASATAVHYENATRKETKERDTPPEDVELIKEYVSASVDGVPITQVKRPRVRVVTEKEGWIMHRKGLEIVNGLGPDYGRINQDWPEADIHYYINYGFFNRRPAKGKLVLNFTHYDPESLADKFVESAFLADHCTSVSELTSLKLFELGVPKDRVTTIRVGADSRFTPKLMLGIPGRPYKGGRKGEDLLKGLMDDPDIMACCRFVTTNPDWGLPAVSFTDHADFYRSIDYLLITSRIEGGPVSFMEALACGTLSIAPPIGVVPEFPHVPYETGSLDSLKAAILELGEQMQSTRGRIARKISHMNWPGWAVRHEKLFRRMMLGHPLS